MYESGSDRDKRIVRLISRNPAPESGRGDGRRLDEVKRAVDRFASCFVVCAVASVPLVGVALALEGDTMHGRVIVATVLATILADRAAAILAARWRGRSWRLILGEVALTAAAILFLFFFFGIFGPSLGPPGGE